MGAHYRKIEQHLGLIDDGDWLEIGVDRGEGSTKFFAEQAGERGVDFVGVDIDPDQIALATKNCSIDGALSPHINLVTSKGEDYLASQHGTDRKFSLVYLDNFDWDYWLDVPDEGFVPAQRAKYPGLLNVPMMNINSELTHLVQAINMMSLLTPNCVVVCDDTWVEPRDGIFIGKCAAALPFLLTQGFKVEETYGYRNRDGGSGAILSRSTKTQTITL